MTSTLSVEGSKTKMEMPPGLWLAATLGSIALLAAVNLIVAWRMDVYGVLRDPRGRELVTSDHERKAKFLLNQAYVPENFDALIIGASASVNWYPEDLTGYRFYNESIEGGDASEERKLVEQALPRGHFKVALVGIYPRITGMHLLQDGFDQVSKSEALGSIGMLTIEYDDIHHRLLHVPTTSFPNGSHPAPDRPPPPADMIFGSIDLTQDPVAVADYRELVQELQVRGVRIIYFSSPLLSNYYDRNKDSFDQFTSEALQRMPPAPLIDFNAPEYAAFRKDRRNFIDFVHLSDRGSATLSQMLNTQIHRILKDQ